MSTNICTFECPQCRCVRHVTFKRLARSLKEGRSGACRSCSLKNWHKEKVTETISIILSPPEPVIEVAMVEEIPKLKLYKNRPSWLTRWIWGER